MRFTGPLILAYFRRAALVWLGLRALLLLARIPPAVSVGTAALIAVMATALGAVDIARRHERALLGNLGIPLGAVLAISALPAVIGEVGLRMIIDASR